MQRHTCSSEREDFARSSNRAPRMGAPHAWQLGQSQCTGSCTDMAPTPSARSLYLRVDVLITRRGASGSKCRAPNNAGRCIDADANGADVSRSTLPDSYSFQIVLHRTKPHEKRVVQRNAFTRQNVIE